MKHHFSLLLIVGTKEQDERHPNHIWTNQIVGDKLWQINSFIDYVYRIYGLRYGRLCVCVCVSAGDVEIVIDEFSPGIWICGNHKLLRVIPSFISTK